MWIQINYSDLKVVGFLSSVSYKLPMANCQMMKDLVKHELKITLIRELTMKTAGIHTPFVKEMYNPKVYYGKPVEVFCMFDIPHNI